jgi:hypothetical protein
MPRSRPIRRVRSLPHKFEDGLRPNTRREDSKMTRNEVAFTPEAEEQLVELYSYIEENATAAVALSYTSSVVEYCEGLQRFRCAGHRGMTYGRPSNYSIQAAYGDCLHHRWWESLDHWCFSRRSRLRDGPTAGRAGGLRRGLLEF